MSRLAQITASSTTFRSLYKEEREIPVCVSGNVQRTGSTNIGINGITSNTAEFPEVYQQYKSTNPFAFNTIAQIPKYIKPDSFQNCNFLFIIVDHTEPVSQDTQTDSLCYFQKPHQFSPSHLVLAQYSQANQHLATSPSHNSVGRTRADNYTYMQS